MERIRVLLADDHAVVRSGVRSLLEMTRDIAVVGEAEDGEQALALAEALKPDVLLLDVQMPGMSGVNVAGRLAEANSSVRVLVLSSYDTEQSVYQLLDSGVAGYLLKGEIPEQIVRAVRGVARGDAKGGWLSPRITAKLRRRVDPSELTSRELQVLSFMVAGHENEEIAAAMYLSKGSIKNHVTSIISKLGARNRTHAVSLALQRGLVSVHATESDGRADIA
jgi:two-component system NarL family response regulator